MSKDDLKSDTI